MRNRSKPTREGKAEEEQQSLLNPKRHHPEVSFLASRLKRRQLALLLPHQQLRQVPETNAPPQRSGRDKVFLHLNNLGLA